MAFMRTFKNRWGTVLAVAGIMVMFAVFTTLFGCESTEGLLTTNNNYSGDQELDWRLPLEEIPNVVFPEIPDEGDEEAFDLIEDEDGDLFDAETGEPIGARATGYTRFEKPVSVNDYNGTYSGVGGTGYYGYTMLYRDSYTAGWSGYEGVGKHPGVDIPAPYRTDLYSSSYGYFYAYVDSCGSSSSWGCGGGWGNFIIIRSRVKTPSTGGAYHYVYFIYAHLADVWGVSGNVSRGQRMGRTGNSGNSTGSHLHFQVDRNNAPFHPWWPSGNVNTPDYNNTVGYYTHNPMLFINNGYAW